MSDDIQKTPAEIAAESHVDGIFSGPVDSPMRKRWESLFVAGWNERPVPTWKKMDDSIDFSQKVIYKMPNGEVTMLYNGHPHIKMAVGYMYVHELAVL